MEQYFWFSAFVAINSLILFTLAANVSRLRKKLQILLGDDGNKTMFDAIRAHCNGLEQAPIFALLILALTFQAASNQTLAILVINFTLARLFHAYGMLYRNLLSRQIGAGVTYLLQLVAILILLVRTFS